MKSVRLALVCAALMVLALTANATTRYVTQSGASPYLTFASAINASAAGDTVLIGPGVYFDPLNLTTRLTFIGAGADLTTFTGYMFVNPGASGSVIEGLKFQSSYYVLYFYAGADSVTIRRCSFMETSSYNDIDFASSAANGHLFIEDCILQNAAGGQCVGAGAGSIVIRSTLFVNPIGYSSTYAVSGANGGVELYNCVFLGFVNVFNLTGATPLVMVNSISYDWGPGSPSWGTYFAGSVFNYNAASIITPPGTNAILLGGNPFVSYDSTGTFVEGVSNLHLAAGNVCINAGHPGILDLDNSRSDLGIYGGPRPLVDNCVADYPFTTNHSVSPNMISVGDSVNVSSSGRIGPRY